MSFNVAVLQLNFVVGDLAGNAQKIMAGYNEAVQGGADLVVTTELALFGYPPKDLLQMPDKLSAQEAYIKEMAFKVGNVPLVIGIAEGNVSPHGKPLYNSAIVLQNDVKIGSHRKMLLPTYDVFDEARYFEPGTTTPRTFEVNGKKVGLLICEDIWGGSEDDGPSLYKQDPVKFLEKQDMDVLVVINASPYYWKKGTERFSLVSELAQRLECSVVYANQVGGNDELIFDGRSFMVNKHGHCVAVAQPFEEQVLIQDVFTDSSVLYPFDHEDIGQLNDALVLGVRDYLSKIGATKAVIGLSGGIDSAVTACLAVSALGPENVLGVLMPSDISSKDSREDAILLARNLGIKYEIVPIGRIYDAVGTRLSSSNETIFEWYYPEDPQFDVAQENVQARIRGLILMTFSNRYGHIVLSTGNKSEVAVGFCTLYGDMCGGLSVLSDAPKTLVYELARYINTLNSWIPENTITKPPSADLRPGQVDTDALPPYDVLDRIIHLFVEEQWSIERIVAEVGDEDVVRKVIRMIRNNEFKRQQMPPGLKVTSKAFGTGRRFPIASR